MLSPDNWCHKACQIRSPDLWLDTDFTFLSSGFSAFNFLSQPHSTPILGIGAVCYAVKEETDTEAHRGNAEDA